MNYDDHFYGVSRIKDILEFGEVLNGCLIQHFVMFTKIHNLQFVYTT